MPLASGATFAGYTILRLLGSDEMGEVYLAQHPRLPHWNSLRVLSTSLTEDREFHDRFMRETPIATTLHHPNIVEIQHRGESEGRLWITMDYVNGTNAAQLVASRFPAGMPIGGVLATVTAVADALDYAHSRGMLHRDVKPANILFASSAAGEQRILLTDFGIARQPADPGGATVAYAAPERLTGFDIDGRADQYALAASAFHLLTGARPDWRLGLADRRPEAARLDDVLSKALAQNPADRFGSCRAFADALRQCGGAWVGDRSPEAYLSVVDYPNDEPATTTPGSPAPAATRRLRWPWILGLAAAAVLLCVGLLGVGIMIGRRNGASVTEGAGPVTTNQTSAPNAAPTTTPRNSPGPEEILDGSYRFDVNRAQQIYNDTPDPQPPNVSTWWAFHTACTPGGCVATGILLDATNHQTVNANGGDKPLVLDFRDGAWQSRPETVPFACVGPNGVPAKQTTTQAIRLQLAHGALRGTMTVAVKSNECGQQGATIQIPAVAARIGDIPTGVQVPTPSTTTSTTPGPTSTPGR